MKLIQMPYEERRKGFFVNLIKHAENKIKYWKRQTGYRCEIDEHLSQAGEEMRYCQEALNALEKLPAADVAPVVHAHWRGYYTQEPYCSNCGFSYDHEQGEDAQTTDYCGNCGAKMDENEVENLSRCPCGDRTYCLEVEKDEKGKWFIRCHMCHRIVWGDTIEEAADKWNRRADTDEY